MIRRWLVVSALLVAHPVITGCDPSSDGTATTAVQTSSGDQLKFDLVGYAAAIPTSLGLTLDTKGPQDISAGVDTWAQGLSDGHGFLLEVSITPDGHAAIDTDSAMKFTKIVSGDREYMTAGQNRPNVYQLGFFAGDALVWLSFYDTDNVDPAASLVIADQVGVTSAP